MLFKLVKYEWRAIVRQVALVWPAMLLIALITRFITHFRGNPIAFITIAVLTMTVLMYVFLFNRFYKSMLGDEGYLMHTLPVDSWQHVASKIICGTVVLTISAIVGAGAMMLGAGMSIPRMLKMGTKWLMFIQLPDYGWRLVAYGVMLVSGWTMQVAHLYACIAVGNLVKRGKWVVIGVLYFVTLFAINALEPDLMIMNYLYEEDALGQGQYVFIADSLMNMEESFKSIIYNLVVAFGCYALSCHILSTELNLE